MDELNQIRNEVDEQQKVGGIPLADCLALRIAIIQAKQFVRIVELIEEEKSR